MITRTFKELENEVRKLAKENPDYVYPRVRKCMYNPDKEQPGCIFGQALARLGISGLPEGNTISTLIEVRKVSITEFTDRDLAWARDVQIAQDSGKTWSLAIKRADNIGPYRPVVD